jgi:hypothetical protein
LVDRVVGITDEEENVMNDQVSRHRKRRGHPSRWRRIAIRGTQMILWGVLSGMAGTAGRMLASGVIMWIGLR